MKQEIYYGEIYYSYDALNEIIDQYIAYSNKQQIKKYEVAFPLRNKV